jgi:hypothetical protein
MGLEQLGINEQALMGQLQPGIFTDLLEMEQLLMELLFRHATWGRRELCRP